MTPAPLKRIAYVSRACLPLTEEQVDQLLAQARTRNRQLTITGILMYDGSTFLQILEGSPRSVDEVYRSISRDSRHAQLRLLRDQSLNQRAFPDWSMGFTGSLTLPAVDDADESFDELLTLLLETMTGALTERTGSGDA